nr:hypothetical protein [Proteus mirabilis]
MPNNSFKPNLLPYTKAMAEKACHGFGSTTQVGLTRAIYHERLAFSCYRNSWRSNRNIRIKI